MTDQKHDIASLRNESASAPVTQEEAAYQLFKFFSDGNPYLKSPQEGLPFFAKCMLAVREPQALLTPEKPNEIKVTGVSPQD